MDRLLIDIASGFYITPTGWDVGVVGSAPAYRLTAHGGAGSVTFKTSPPSGGVLVEPALPGGRDLVDNGDGTADVVGTYTVATVARSRVWAYDGAGRVAVLDAPQTVRWSYPPYVSTQANGYALTAQFHIDASANVTGVSFDPPLPPGWTTDVHSDNRQVGVFGTSGAWTGAVVFEVAEYGGGVLVVAPYRSDKVTIPFTDTGGPPR